MSEAKQSPFLSAGIALLLGMATGQRTFTPSAVASAAAASGAIDLDDGPLALLASPLAAGALSLLAGAEYYGDVQPDTPPRIKPQAVAARALGGALAGAATAPRGHRAIAAIAGAGGAALGAWIGYRMRETLAEATSDDRPVAIAEDALSLGGAVMLTAIAARR